MTIHLSSSGLTRGSVLKDNADSRLCGNDNVHQGFTVIEFILVIAIISIIAGFSTSFYSRYIQQNAVFTTSDELLGDLRRAQILAMMGKRNTNWGVNVSGTTLTLYSGSSYAARSSAFDETFTINGNITVTGMTDINFNRPTGTPSATPTITIRGLGSTKTITVNSYGVASR